MAEPTAFPVTLYIDSTDRTSFVPYQSLRLDDKRVDVSTLSFRLENPSFTPSANDKIRLFTKDLERLIFEGIVTDVRSIRRGVVTDYELTASDNKIRLQKAVVKPGVYTGDIGTILDDLLGNTFPDLSASFNVDADSFPDTDYDFEFSDISLSDALNTIADELGVDINVEEPTLTGTNNGVIITFDVADTVGYTTSSADTTLSVNVGNGKPNADGTPSSGLKAGPSTFIDPFGFPIGPDNTIDEFIVQSQNWSFADNMLTTGVKFDYKTLVTGDEKLEGEFGVSEIFVSYWTGPSTTTTVITNTPSLSSDGLSDSWVTSELIDFGETYRIKYVRITFGMYADSSKWQSGGPSAPDSAEIEVTSFIDNIVLMMSPDSGVTPNVPLDPDEVVLPKITVDLPPLPPFDFDIGDLDTPYLDELIIDESQDDYNAVVVIGGTVKEAIDWTYESDGDQDHFDLELPITDYTIYVNGGTDVSPVWNVITPGVRGKDDLSRNGGSVGVLYDAKYHWLYFNTNPPALAKAFRVEAFIEQAVRIAVSEAAAGEPVLAMPLYDANIISEDGAVSRARTELDKRNGPQRIQFTTYEPGLYPGMVIGFDDSGRGLSTSSTIQRVTTKWLGGSGHAEFQVEAGPSEELNGAQIIADNDKRSRQRTDVGGVSDVATIGILTDDSDNELTDNDDLTLFEVT